MNINQIAMIQKLKTSMDTFRNNHPKDALMEGTIIEITVTTPQGKNYCTNVKLKPEDMELMESFKNMK